MTQLAKERSVLDIKPRILEMDTSLDNEQILDSLIKFSPTDEERRKLSPYLKAQPEELRKLSLPDQFELQVMIIVKKGGLMRK